MLRQRTLKNTIRATGVGLHSGKKVLMVLRPAPVDTGVVFRRTDLNEPVDVRAYAENVGDTMLGTSLFNGDVRVVDGRTSVVGVRRARARQRLCGFVGGRSADHGRQRRSVCVSAAVRGHRRTPAPKRFVRDSAAAGSARRRQVGALRTVQRFQGQLRNRVQSSDIQEARADRDDGFLHDVVS